MQGPNDRPLTPQERDEMQAAKKAIMDQVDKAWVPPSDRAQNIMRHLMDNIYGPDNHPEEISGALLYDITCFCVETLVMITEQTMQARGITQKDPLIHSLLWQLYENHYSDPQNNIGPADRLFWPPYPQKEETPRKKYNEHGISVDASTTPSTSTEDSPDGLQQEQENSDANASNSPKNHGSEPRLLDS